MTKSEINKIESLKNKGLSYKNIAETLNISEGTIKSYFSRKSKKKEEINYCKYCHKPFSKTAKNGVQEFCSNKCRLAYHYALKKCVDHVCPNCGKHFKTRKNSHQIYCSHECYIKMRYHSK